MRHRAPHSFLARLPLPDPARRRVLAAAALAVTAALTGVGVVVQHDDAAPSASRSPVTARLGTPSSATPPTLTNSPSKAVSRGGDRKPAPSPTPLPSPLPSPTSTSPAAAETSALPLVTRTPKVGVPAASKKPTPSSPSPSVPASPSPVDGSAPDTAASTSAVGGGSWTVAVSADEPASYECSLDGGSYQSCGGSTTFSDLDNGWHSLSARATDQAGNTDPSPAELSAKVTGAH